ncbi:MAG: F0F1 ATP synthase subunit delta [Xanthomonadales bacterium]|nr:F0F1 ATP synthase subunit delta [Xanthomonadales bacterium]
MSSLTTLARPYAKAAFELARDESALLRWDEMLTLAGTIASDEAMASLLESPHVSGAEAAKLIVETAGDDLAPRFRDFLDVLAANGRLPLLPEITRIFRKLREEAENRLRVRVVSAVALDEDQAGRMKAALSRRFDCEIELENEIDERVIGGAVVYAGDQVIDGSLRGRLEKLSTSLAN